MEYMKVRLFLPEDCIELVTERLETQGVTGVEVVEPSIITDLLDKEHSYDWDYIGEGVRALAEEPASLTFYLEDTIPGIEQLDLILDELAVLPITSVEVSEIAETQWIDNWKQYFKPTKVTDRLVVKPSWEPYEPIDDEEEVIEIDPGMAFGTGTHATTSLCLRLMERYLKPGEFVLDIGTGSGILALGAAKLGANRVLGIDLDPVAVEVAKTNVTRNRAEDTISIQQGDLTAGWDGTADLIVANLMADLILTLANGLGPYLNPGGFFLSSGILTEQRQRVENGIMEQGFELVETIEEGDWCAIAARRG